MSEHRRAKRKRAQENIDVVDTMTRSSFGMCTLGKFTPVEVPKGTKF